MITVTLSTILRAICPSLCLFLPLRPSQLRHVLSNLPFYYFRRLIVLQDWALLSNYVAMSSATFILLALALLGAGRSVVADPSNSAVGPNRPMGQTSAPARPHLWWAWRLWVSISGPVLCIVPLLSMSLVLPASILSASPRGWGGLGAYHLLWGAADQPQWDVVVTTILMEGMRVRSSE